ncbi:MAG: cytochrome b N-terminal domain-containing protein [Thermoplasmata archaeon]
MFVERFNRTLDRVWAWFERQVGLVSETPGPPKEGDFRPSAWTGAFVLAAIAYQVVSGGLLLLYYQPSVYPTLTLCGQASGVVSASPAAWCSTYFIVHSVPLGALLLTTHLYGAYAVILLMFVHLFRGYYVGAYKKPGREASWVVGVVVLLLVLGMGFTGYLLAYTQLSYNATEVSVTLAQALPLVGPPIANLIAGDGTPQSLLSRMFAFHVILLPVAIAVLVFWHKRTALFPRVYLYLVKWGLLYVGLLIGVASLWPWQLPTYAGNLGATQPVTVPAWYFLWLFKLVDFVGVTPEDAMLFTVVVVLFLLLLPFIDRSRHLHPRDRPVFLFLGNSLVSFFILMTVWGDLTPGLPITPTEVALRLGPVLAANALVVAFFYWRYRTTWGAPTATRDPAREPPPVVAPSPSPSPVAPESQGAAFPPPPSRPREPVISLSMLLSVLGLVGALFLLTFGLVLPFLFLMAAFLVNIAEAARPLPPAGRSGRYGPSRALVFPILALLAVAFLLVALVATVLL